MNDDTGAFTGEIIDILDQPWIDWDRVIAHAREEHVGLVGTSLMCLYVDGDDNLVQTDIRGVVSLPVTPTKEN